MPLDPQAPIRRRPSQHRTTTPSNAIQASALIPDRDFLPPPTY
ncbi:hypothetical protein [Xylella fastidiosa]|nr:hypothetical protein [Xylella fastidiosa]MDG4872965.1 hypothetical protein [Xylella fastidiosa subsp. multiplex]